jgi:hypothetical protein
MIGIFDGCLFKYGAPLRIGGTANDFEEENVIQVIEFIHLLTLSPENIEN